MPEATRCYQLAIMNASHKPPYARSLQKQDTQSDRNISESESFYRYRPFGASKISMPQVSKGVQE
ncbi:hypothetical protein J6590_008561 [Homalodisca vitripennis]|nr:hypothetical protein J6590_008561 [Homalodisca vitripennis]